MTASPRPVTLDPRPLPPEVAADVERYNRLSEPEKDRVRRLICSTGCTIGQAVSAVVATREEGAS